MNLKQQTINSVAWNGVGNVTGQVLRVLTLVIMARLLTPEDYGVFAILMIFVGFFSVFGHMGISQAVIYLDNPSGRMLSSIFYLNFSVGVALYLILFVLAVPIAAFFERIELVDLLRVIGIVLILEALQAVQKALLQKKIEFRKVVFVEVGSQVFGSAVGIGMAVAGYGVASLVFMALTGAAARTVFLWRGAGWYPSFMFSWADIHVIWNYCFNLTGFSIINYFARNADNFLIGKFLGSSVLGVYNMAYNIMLYPLNNVAGVIVRVLFPALSTIKNDNQGLKQAYLKVIRFIALVTFPLMFGLAVVSDTFVLVVFGERWHSLAPLLLILSTVGLLQSIVTTVGTIYMLKGTTSLMFKIGAINAGVVVLSFIIGLPFGVKGVAIAYALANLILLYPNLKLAWDQIDLGIMEALNELKHFFLSSMVMAIVVQLLGQWMGELDLPLYSILGLQVGFGVFVYVGVLLVVTRLGVIDMVREVIPRARHMT